MQPHRNAGSPAVPVTGQLTGSEFYESADHKTEYITGQRNDAGGSDYPALRPKDAVMDVLSLDLGDEINEMIFYKNARRILNISL